MRMSDWSSDVCSSELGLDVGPARIDVLFRGRDRIDPAGAHGHRRGEHDSITVFHALSSSSPLLPYSRRSALQGETEIGVRQGRFQDVERIQGIRDARQRARSGDRGDHRRRVRDDHRSEEHTSELQSLMRISYAVFCLKKKNNNTYSQTTTHLPHETY